MNHSLPSLAPAPIPVAHLFAPLDEHLLRLLRSLRSDDWSKPTLAAKWTVKDVAAHLLDGNVRTLSIQRDGYVGVSAPATAQGSYSGLVDWLNSLNHEWVQAAQRLSPDVLLLLLEATSSPTNAYYESLDLWSEAPFPVDWAGESRSYQWMHLAREYTEKWHHQQQIREAVGQTAELMTRELFYPCIDTFMRGLPHTYRTVSAPVGTLVHVCITGDAGGLWILERTNGAWVLSPSATAQPTAILSLPPEVAWKVCTKGISLETARRHAQITGDTELGAHALRMVSVMAQPREFDLNN